LPDDLFDDALEQLGGDGLVEGDEAAEHEVEVGAVFGQVAHALVEALERRLQEQLATRARIRGAKKGKGFIEVPFHNMEDFERLFALIAGVEASDVVS